MFSSPFELWKQITAKTADEMQWSPSKGEGATRAEWRGIPFTVDEVRGVGVAGIVRGSEGLMRILKRLEEDFPQLRYHRQAGLNVCVCVWHAVCYRNCLFSCLFSHIFPLASSAWWVMWNDLQTVQVAVSIELNCKKIYSMSRGLFVKTEKEN